MLSQKNRRLDEVLEEKQRMKTRLDLQADAIRGSEDKKNSLIADVRRENKEYRDSILAERKSLGAGRREKETLSEDYAATPRELRNVRAEFSNVRERILHLEIKEHNSLTSEDYHIRRLERSLEEARREIERYEDIIRQLRLPEHYDRDPVTSERLVGEYKGYSLSLRKQMHSKADR